MSRCRVPLRTEDGTVLFESAFCLAIFLFSLFAAFDLLRLSHFYLAVQHAVQMTTSAATAGNVESGSRVVAITDDLIQRARRFGVRIDADEIWVCPASSSPYCAEESAGEPRTDFQITVRAPAYVSSLRREFVFEFDAQGRNERAN